MENLPDTIGNHELSEQEKDEKLMLYDQHHADISNFMLQHLQKYGTMPSKSLIAKETGLSRKTIYKHLRASAHGIATKAHLETFGVMVELVTAQALRAALRGDLKAIKLFLETTRTPLQINGANKKTSKQNSYVQINKTIINQQIIQQLKPEQLKRIEEMITTELSKNTGNNG
jgi:DNA-binding phage protein